MRASSSASAERTSIRSSGFTAALPVNAGTSSTAPNGSSTYTACPIARRARAVTAKFSPFGSVTTTLPG
jgi:hypothetical protein